MIRRMRTATRARRLKPDPVWIRARHDLLARLKAEVRARVGPEPPDLASYNELYEREFEVRWRPVEKEELLACVEKADIVYGGDFHALGQAQRTHLRILRSLPEGRPVILALECFAESAQKWLNRYLLGDITLEELREKSDWDRSWGFPWDNYRHLLELAKRRGFELLALNESSRKLHGNLKAREKTAAKLIAAARARAPGAIIYVIFGDLHLSAKHLPALVRARAKGVSLREVTVHLNSERIYFQLARRGLEHTTDVVKLAGRGDRYCVMGSPPWVQWQSYLFFLEHADDLDLEMIDATFEEEFDPTDQVASLVKTAAADLGLSMKIDDLAVFSGDESRVWQALERKLKARGDRIVARQLLSWGRSFFLPNAGTGYLGQSTVNHAAALAGQYLHAKLSRRARPMWRMPADFQALIWVEAVGYFVSKLINHKRRAETLGTLRAQLAALAGAQLEIEAMRLALDRALSDLVYVKEGRRRPSKVRVRRKSSYFEAARILGGMLGERLYLAFRSRKLTGKEIEKLLRTRVDGKDFSRTYLGILRRLERVG